MRATLFLVSALASIFVAARPQAQQGATCFDAGDCILSGGGDCQKPAGALLGTCTAKAAAGGATGAAGTPPAATPAAGATCFDAGDCILSGGGDCNKAAGALTGTCKPKAAAASAAGAAPSAGGLDALLGGATA